MESQLSQTGIAVSNAPEATYNDMYVLGTDFTAMLTRSRNFPLPSTEKSDNLGVIGRGSKGIYPSVQRTGFLEPTVIEFQYEVNVGSFITLLTRFMGKPELVGDIQVVEASIAWRHHFYEQDPDVFTRQLPSSSIVYRNNGADFVYGGMVGSTLQIQQAGVADPQFTMQETGSGLSERVRDIDPAFGDTGDAAEEDFMLGAESTVQYTDPTTTRSLTANKRLKSISFTANNNIDTGDLRAGSPRVNGTACPGGGWYRDFLLMGDKTAAAEFRATLDDNLYEWTSAQLNEIITNFDWTMRGYCIPDSAADNQYSVKLSIGKSYFRTPRGGEDNNTMIQDTTVFPITNASYWGAYKFEVVNAKAGITL